MITVFAPDGIGEITPDSDLASMIIDAVAVDEHGPLHDGDVVVVTSKIISKHEGRVAAAADKLDLLTRETRRTVARRGQFAIVETRGGLVQAAAGIDNSNVEVGTILALPVDADASAARLLAELTRRTGLTLGVIISDTSGRAWRIGQTDHAIGSAGVTAVLRYAGTVDAYGNPLQVTEMAVADELAAAADLAKRKLGGRPVAVVRGTADLVVDPSDAPGAVELIRPVAEDLFRLGTRESVIEAVAVAVGAGDRAETLYAGTAATITAALVPGLDPATAALVESMIARACADDPEPVATLGPAQPK